MPLYADFYAYGPSPVFSATHYSALLYLGSSSSSSYSSRFGSLSSTPSWSPLPSSPRLLPASRHRRFAPPSLPTISETSCSPILSSSPRLRSHYSAPRPIRIDTADIDVTSPRSRGPFDRSSDGSGDRKGSPKERAGTIRRGRTVVRLHTRRLKDGPPPSALAAVAKTPGERLVEKFYIHDSPSRETKQRPKVEDTAPPPREVIAKPDEKEVEESEEDESSEEEDESSEEEEESTEKVEDIKVDTKVEKEGEKEVIQQDISKVKTVESSDKTKPCEILKESKVNDSKDGDGMDVKTDQVKSKVLSLVDPSGNASVVEKLLSSDEKLRRVPKFVVGDVSIEVRHSPPPSNVKLAKRLRMQVEVVVEGQEKVDELLELSGVNAKNSTPGAPTTHSLPSSPLPVASSKPQLSKFTGDFSNLWAERDAGEKAGEFPKTARGERAAKARVAVDRKFENSITPTPKNQSSQVTPETPAIREGAGEKKTPTKEDGIPAKVLAAEVSKRVTPPPSPTKKSQPESNLKVIKEAEKQDLAAQKIAQVTENRNFSGQSIPEARKFPAGSPTVTKPVSKSSATASEEKRLLLGKQEKLPKSENAVCEVTLETEVKETKKTANLEKHEKIIKKFDVKLASQPIDIKDSPAKPKETISSFSDDSQKQKHLAKKAEDGKQTNQKSDNKISIGKSKEVIPFFNDKQKQVKTGKEEVSNISTKVEEVRGPTLQLKDTPLLIQRQKEEKIANVDVKQICSAPEKKVSLAKEPVPQLSPENVKEQSVAKDKVTDKAHKLQSLNSSKISNAVEKPEVVQSKPISPTSPQNKLNAKKENSTFPLIIDKNQKTVNSETTLPVKMIKIPYPQKSPIPKVIEKPWGLLAKLQESEKMLQVEEPEKKTETAKAPEKIGRKEEAPGTIPTTASIAGGNKDASNTTKEPTSQKTASIPQKSSSPITAETPTKDATSTVNKSDGIKAELKGEPKPETVATKTKSKALAVKAPQELRKLATANTTDLRVDKEERAQKEEKAPEANATPSENSKAPSKKGENKTQISTDSAQDTRKQAETPVEAKLDKVVKKDSPKTPGEESKKKIKVSKKEPQKAPSEATEPLKTPPPSKKAIPEQKKLSAKKEDIIPIKIKTPVKEEMKAKDKTVDAGTLLVPPMIEESEESTSEEESDSEEDTDDEEDSEEDSEDDEERQLREETIRRASVLGTSAAPAKSLPRFRDYNEKDFLFLRVLGKGSFGKVFLAVLRDTDRHYAIKCLKKQSVIEEEDVECTLIERKVLSLATAHPFLCHLYCTFQSETHLFFVMEYLNGGDLMFHIQRYGKFEQERAQFYAAEIVSGLKFLHKKSIVYRDLKLDNILLDYQGHIRIADFGMCKLQIFLDRTADTFCGTPDYIAPEIIKGYRYNQTVDWWSFGVLLYEMLVGQSPFTGCDEDELFWCICNESPLFPQFLSRDARDILARLLNKNADRRLGAQGCSAGDVCDQPFFRSIDWWRLERKELEPPFKPALKHLLDLQYFEATFTCEKARLTPPPAKRTLTPEDQQQFEGFSYTNPNATD